MMAKEQPTASTSSVLQALSSGCCLTIDQLCLSLGMPRRKVSNSAALLLRRDYLIRTAVGCYQLSEAGLTAAASGELITSGPNGPNEKVRAFANTFRQRAWRSMRIRRAFSIADVVADAATEEDSNAASNAARYIHYLKSAGYVAELPRRRIGTALTSNGFKQFLIRRDTGPLAPVVRVSRKIIHDFNIGKDIPCRPQH